MPKRYIYLLSFNPYHNNSGRCIIILILPMGKQSPESSLVHSPKITQLVNTHSETPLAVSSQPPSSQWLLFTASRKRSQTSQHQSLVGLIALFLILNQHISSVHYTMICWELISLIQFSGAPSLHSTLRRLSFQTCTSSWRSMTGPQERDACRAGEVGGFQILQACGPWKCFGLFS